MNPIQIRLCAALAICMASCGALAAPYGTNLIAGGDAETGTAAWTAYQGTPLFIAADYGSNWVLPSQPGPANRGARLFVGGSEAYAAGYQVVDVSAQSAAINTGSVGYDLTGWLGGWTSQGDNAMLYVSFLDAASQVLGTAALGPVTPAHRNNSTGLIYQEASGLLPVNTHHIELALSMERLNPNDNDGYADNLSFTLAAAVPEPQTCALMLAGLVAVGALAARRTR
jgi:hypothetical protein